MLPSKMEVDENKSGLPTVVNIEDYAMPVESLKKQVNLIQQAMKSVMKKDEHYGVVPGTRKPTLLKPGAEKLCLLFRLSPKYEIIREVRTNDHIAYTVKCDLYHAPSQNFVASGVGSCNSRESKYLYRWENTGKLVPKKYWETRDKDLLGGEEFEPKKVGDKYVIFKKVVNENPWDLDNTIVKMACKRALIAAVLNATAASDIFTQDQNEEEDINPNPSSPQPSNQSKTTSETNQQSSLKEKNDKVTQSQLKMMGVLFSKLGITNRDERLANVSNIIGREISSSNDLTKEEASKVIEELKTAEEAME